MLVLIRINSSVVLNVAYILEISPIFHGTDKTYFTIKMAHRDVSWHINFHFSKHKCTTQNPELTELVRISRERFLQLCTKTEPGIYDYVS
jgi:hypothetical protein